MSLKILFVVDSSENARPDDGFVTRKELNVFLEDDWEIESEETEVRDDISGTEFRLKKDSKAVTVQKDSSPEGPSQQGVSIFGSNGPTDAAGQLIATMQNVASSVAGGSGHLGGGVIQGIPGAQLVSAQEVGMARDYGVTAGYQGKSVEDCPFPKGSKPRALWMDGHQQGSSQRLIDNELLAKIDWDLVVACANDPTYVGNAAIDELVDAYREGRRSAQCSSPDDVIDCHLVGKNVRAAWIRGFESGGGSLQ